MNIGAGSHTQASLECGRDVGNDVPKHVVGYDHIEGTGIANQLHAERVHIHMLGFNLRIFGAHSFENALPQATRVSHGVGFVAHEHAAARAAIGFFVVSAIIEGVADNTFDALASIDVLLDRKFVGSSLLEDAAGISVNALGVFAEDDEVYVFGLDSFQGTE